MKLSFSKVLPKGSVLVFSLIILSVMLVMSLTLLSSAVLDQKASLSTANSTRSFQVADSGAEQVLYQIYKGGAGTIDDIADGIGGSSSCVGGTISDTSSGWTVRFYDVDGNRLSNCDESRDNIVALKSEGSAQGTVRAVEVAVAASGLTCVNASRKGAGGMNVYYADGTTVSGDTSEVRELSGSEPDLPSVAWGMECIGGYQRTGCMFSNTGSAGGATMASDWDVSFDSDYLQGCFSDDEEENENGVLVITCCR